MTIENSAKINPNRVYFVPLGSALRRNEGTVTNFPSILPIKLVRTITGCSLAEGKEFVDSYKDSINGNRIYTRGSINQFFEDCCTLVRQTRNALPDAQAEIKKLQAELDETKRKLAHYRQKLDLISELST